MNGVRLPEINFILLAGRITRDAELFVTQSGLPKCSMRIAVNRRVKDAKSGEWKDDVFYIDVIAWRELAERAKDRAKKGVALTLEGRLSSREYEDKSGQKRAVFEVTANRIQFLSLAASEDASKIAGAAAAPEAIEEVPF